MKIFNCSGLTLTVLATWLYSSSVRGTFRLALDMPCPAAEVPALLDCTVVLTTKARELTPCIVSTLGTGTKAEPHDSIEKSMASVHLDLAPEGRWQVGCMAGGRRPGSTHSTDSLTQEPARTYEAGFRTSRPPDVHAMEHESS